MKIHVFSDWWSPYFIGGAEKSAQLVARRLVSDGHQVQVFTLRNNSKYSDFALGIRTIPNLAVRRSPYANYLIRILDKIRIYLDFITPLFFVKELLESDPDVIILHQVERIGSRGLKKLVKRKGQIPVLRVYHDFSDTCLLRTRFRNNRVCENTCSLCVFKQDSTKRISLSFDYLITNSVYTKGKFVELGYKPDFEVGYPNVELLVDGHDSITHQCKDIGYVGRIHPTKGLEQLIKAASLIERDIFIVGSGDGGYIQTLESIADEVGVSLKFLGSSEDPYQSLYGLVSLIAVPSLWEEPFGRVPLEAVSRGFKVVAADMGGLPESRVFTDPPFNLFAPNDPYSIADAILKAEAEDFPVFNEIEFNSLTLPETVSRTVGNLKNSGNN
jgi:glycosyltransferase involved in cell wall biosynthesis